MTALWIALAGGAGAVSRFVADGLLRTIVGRKFPWATVIINASGALLLGYLTGLATQYLLSADTKLIWGTGFCGGYTTFSTASFEVVRLLEDQRIGAAMLYILSSIVLSLCLFWLGMSLAPV